jgi:hypothetical protein
MQADRVMGSRTSGVVIPLRRPADSPSEKTVSRKKRRRGLRNRVSTNGLVGLAAIGRETGARC